MSEVEQQQESWAKSLLYNVNGLCKMIVFQSLRKDIPLHHFKEQQDEFLADIQAETLMNDSQKTFSLIGITRTPCSLVPTGEWTMHQTKAMVIPSAHSDDRRQVTAVLAVK